MTVIWILSVIYIYNDWMCCANGFISGAMTQFIVSSINIYFKIYPLNI